MRALLHRLILGVGTLSALLSAAPAQAAPVDADKVLIAVRVDARPFIWEDEVSGKYLGFLWDVCTEAVQRAGYTFSETEVEATARAEFLSNGTGGYDLLCDPTTMTLQRFENFTAGGPNELKALQELEFSPIIFVANASYVENVRNRELPGNDRNLPPGCGEPIERPVTAPASPDSNGADSAMGRNTNSAGDEKPTWLQRQERRFGFKLRPEKEATAEKFQIWGYVSGSTSRETVERHARTTGFALTCRPMPSHEQAARAFCEGELDRYYGDMDIVREAIADWNRKHNKECTVPPRTSTTEDSYEPYAFVVSSGRLPDFPERFALALYGMFSDGTIERAFDGHFPDTAQSQYLSTLFRLNSIPVGAGEPGNGSDQIPSRSDKP